MVKLVMRLIAVRLSKMHWSNWSDPPPIVTLGCMKNRCQAHSFSCSQSNGHLLLYVPFVVLSLVVLNIPPHWWDSRKLPVFIHLKPNTFHHPEYFLNLLTMRQSVDIYVACHTCAVSWTFCIVTITNIKAVSVDINVHQDLMFTTVFTHGKSMIVRTCSKQVQLKTLHL